MSTGSSAGPDRTRPAGHRPATLSDVAALAGVSVSAVSRVLTDAPSSRVSAATRDRIKAAASELDYRPNFAGRALRSARSNIILLIVPDLTNALFTDLMQGVEDAALERNYMVMLARAEALQQGDDTIRKLVGEGRVDGMLVQLGDTSSREDLAAFAEVKVPLVFINSIVAGHTGAVVLENERAARIATEHLIGLGHRRIGLVTGGGRTFTAVERARGFQETMRAADLPVDPAHIRTLGYEPRMGRQAFREIMSQNAPPTALLIANINAAIGALAEARTMGLRIPEDVSVVAVHDAWSAENTWPPLTTVKLPLYEMGKRAVQSFWDCLDTGAAKNIVVSQPAPALVIRESTGPAPRQDERQIVEPHT